MTAPSPSARTSRTRFCCHSSTAARRAELDEKRCGIVDVLTLPLDTRLIGFDLSLANALALLRFRVDVHHRRTIRRARRLPLPQPARSQQPLTMSTSVPIARSHFHCPPTQPSTPAPTARRRTPAPAVLNNPTHHTPLARRQIAEESAHRSWRDPKSWITADIHVPTNGRCAPRRSLVAPPIGAGTSIPLRPFQSQRRSGQR